MKTFVLQSTVCGEQKFEACMRNGKAAVARMMRGVLIDGPSAARLQKYVPGTETQVSTIARARCVCSKRAALLVALLFSAR
jgi:hypothetical protein